MSGKGGHYKCGACGEQGHNRTTCPHGRKVPSQTSPRNKVKPVAVRLRSRCSVCRAFGHNTTTCPNKEVSMRTLNKRKETNNKRISPFVVSLFSLQENSRTNNDKGKENTRTNSTEKKENTRTNNKSVKRKENSRTNDNKRKEKNTRTNNNEREENTRTNNKKREEKALTIFKRGMIGGSYKCGACGELGHNRTTCEKPDNDHNNHLKESHVSPFLSLSLPFSPFLSLSSYVFP